MFKASLNLRIDKYTKDTLMMLKSQNNKSVSHIVRLAIKEYLNKEEIKCKLQAKN